ncbi:MAG: VIT1/CCC1 transporter family protein [Alphaproteobacteria bacterium]|nr:VIT1/CCC1 transporter family protein [Alphaproteobacteria bacterium]
MKKIPEDKIKYIGAMVLGFHDAIVELAGVIVGLAFVFSDNATVALAGIVAGVSSSISMGASNYLAQKADGSPYAIKSGIYTGMAYLLTVVLLIVPFIVLDDRGPALGVMAAIAVVIIFAFNHAVSCAKPHKFLKNSFEMICICIIVSVISFGIGQAAKMFLGLNL